MFRRQPPPLPPPPDERLIALDGLQSGSDQVTEGSRFLADTRAVMKQEGVHPWHASDMVLVKMAYAAIALANDRTAEILRENCVVSVKGRPEMTPDASDFALGLSEVATTLMADVKSLTETQNTVAFDDETRAALSAESMLPYWPRMALDAQNAQTMSWQGDEKAIVTRPFLQSILSAGRNLEDYAILYANELCDPRQTGVELPPEYDSMGLVLSDLRSSAASNLTSAENILLVPSPENIPPRNLNLAYGFLHRGFVVMMDSLVATACPPVLGEEFLPQR